MLKTCVAGDRSKWMIINKFVLPPAGTYPLTIIKSHIDPNPSMFVLHLAVNTYIHTYMCMCDW